MTSTADTLLAWYDRNRRRLPWRATGEGAPDPYRVWLSEIMLQQTTVATVKGYYERFLERWPTVADLAAAPLDDVLHAWAGLGYYARARNLHACARAVTAHHDGRFPGDESALRALPGIGDYTAAAIAAIAFDRPTTPVDGNIERVVARLYAIETPLPQAKPAIRAAAAALTPARRPGDFAQGMMDLGATVCTPRGAKCLLCPFVRICAAHAGGLVDSLPRKAPKPERPVRHGVAFWAVRPDGSVLLRRRPESGLLGGMMEIPSTPWRDTRWSETEARRTAPLAAMWRRLPGQVRHTFTHFHLELDVMAAPASRISAVEGVWCPVDRFDEHALPSLMRKVVRLALAQAGRTGAGRPAAGRTGSNLGGRRV